MWHTLENLCRIAHIVPEKIDLEKNPLVPSSDQTGSGRGHVISSTGRSHGGLQPTKIWWRWSLGTEVIGIWTKPGSAPAVKINVEVKYDKKFCSITHTWQFKRLSRTRSPKSPLYSPLPHSLKVPIHMAIIQYLEINFHQLLQSRLEHTNYSDVK